MQPLKLTLIVAVAFAAFSASAAYSDEQVLFNDSTQLYVDSANNNIHDAIAKLAGMDRANAERIAQYPIASWLSGGTPADVQAKIASLVKRADAAKALPVAVAYNIPYRDCQQYSSGGAADTAAYKRWIDALAAGIGDYRIAIILEPDSMGIVPYYTDIRGNKEWCRPKNLDPATAAQQHFAQLNYAVDKLKSLPHTAVYLDGSHSAWLDVGDSARRLVRAGILRADGFFLNASNYQTTPSLIRYGTWVSKCIHYATQPSAPGRAPRFADCATYKAAAVDDQTRLRTANDWYAHNVDKELTTGSALTHFVIDTSRNGRGPWQAPRDKYPDAQPWCNPPDRGLGDRPTTQTHNSLLDAKLWIKVPGESDGQCTRGTKGPADPARGTVDPPAGKWFKEQAAELIEYAQPPLKN